MTNEEIEEVSNDPMVVFFKEELNKKIRNSNESTKLFFKWLPFGCFFAADLIRWYKGKPNDNSKI